MPTGKPSGGFGGMTGPQAENAVTISALITGGMYAYRYLAEGETKGKGKESLGEKGYLAKYKAFYGFGPVLPLGTWIPAAGVTYLALAILASASPQVGGSAAILVGTGAFFGNALAVQKDLTKTKSTKTKLTGTEPEQPEEGSPEAKAANHPPIALAAEAANAAAGMG